MGPPLPSLPQCGQVHAHTLALHPWLCAKQVLELSLFCKSGLGAAADARQGGGAGDLCRRAIFREKHRIVFLPSGQARIGEGEHVFPPISTMR